MTTSDRIIFMVERIAKYSVTEKRPEFGPIICGFCGGKLFQSAEDPLVSVCENYARCRFAYSLRKNASKIGLRLSNEDRLVKAT